MYYFNLDPLLTPRYNILLIKIYTQYVYLFKVHIGTFKNYWLARSSSKMNQYFSFFNNDKYYCSIFQHMTFSPNAMNKIIDAISSFLLF